MQTKWLVGVAIVLFSTLCFAAGGGGHDVGIPFGKIGIQALNLGILLAVLVFFVRKPLVQFFAQRRVVFAEQSQKTAMALMQAEAELKEIKEKLAKLEGTEGAAIDKAKQEAELLKTRLVREAEAQSKKIKDDVAMVINAELIKARAEIRKEIIEASLSEAQKTLASASESITKKSEKGFVEDLSQVKT
jgi:F-type H+-transporting ATPase subunit b